VSRVSIGLGADWRIPYWGQKQRFIEGNRRLCRRRKGRVEPSFSPEQEV